MDLDQLKGFYYVARLGSFTEAAGRLYLTQPAISLQIKALERELGERLLERSGRRVRLTPAGETILAHAEAVLGKLDELEQAARELKGLERGHLALGASDTTSLYRLPALLVELRKAYPGMEVSLKSLMSREVVKLLLDRELDLGIITIAKPLRGLESIPLYRDPLVCIVSHRHPWAKLATITGREVAAEPLILLEPRSLTRELIDQALGRSSDSPRPRLELSNFEVIKRYVASDLGVSLVPRSAVDSQRDGIAQLPLQKEVHVTLGVAHRKGQQLSRAARVFLDLARRHFGK